MEDSKMNSRNSYTGLMYAQ